MAEYAGYVKRGTPINWGTVANDLVEKIGNVEKEQAAFREKYDSIAAKTSAEIGKYEAGQSPQLNDLAYNMIADGRTTLSALHEKLKRREISPDAFNRAAMSMQTQNQEFKTMLNTYNANVADLEKGISDGTLSSLSDFQLDVYQDISDLSNKKFQWASNPDGITNLYVNTIDKDGNPVKQPMSLSSIRDMGNMRYEKYDIDTNLAKSIKSLGVYDINNISDARNNKQYDEWKQSLINDATVGDRAATILADYGDFVPYKQGDDIPKDKDGNNIGIEMVLKPNGQYEPNITPELRDKAKTIVDESIEARVGRTVRPGKAAKDPSGYSNNQINEFTTGHDIVWKAAGGDFEGMNLTNYDFKVLKDGIQVYKKEGGKQRPIGKPLKVGTVETARTLSKYSKEFGTSAQQSKFDIIQNRRGTMGSDLEIIGEDVEIKSYSPSSEEISVLISSNDSIFNTVDKDYDEASVLESKAKIEEFIKLKAPGSNVSFRTSSEKGTGTDDYKETVILINGSPIRDKNNQLLKIQHDKRGFTKEKFLDIITRAINEAQKKKRFIVQTPGETQKDVSPNSNVAENNQEKDDFG